MTTPSGPDQTRLRLLTAAAEEMLQRGYAAASLSAIAGRLGLTKGAFGHHFPTKQSIVVALLERADEVVDDVGAQASALFPESPLRACVAFFAGLGARGSADPVAAVAMALHQDLAVPASAIMPTRARMRAVIEALLRQAADRESLFLRMAPDDAALFLLTLTSGELSGARFIEGYGPELAMQFLAAGLSGIGVEDAQGVVTDGVRAIWGA
ncbi:TetR/AcrR family transcriptional regulator [Microbacterium sp.]|uniref:TetR/AcrR family transcriptional regulator n=1 Tax=Microbacterium sp. TaxID=51671 RepID=UPI00333EA591